MDPNILTISQMCQRHGVTPRTLRFYEELGLLSPRERDRSSSMRTYDENAQCRLRLVREGVSLRLSLREIGALLRDNRRSLPVTSLLALMPTTRLELELEAARNAERRAHALVLTLRNAIAERTA